MKYIIKRRIAILKLLFTSNVPKYRNIEYCGVWKNSHETPDHHINWDAKQQRKEISHYHIVSLTIFSAFKRRQDENVKANDYKKSVLHLGEERTTKATAFVYLRDQIFTQNKISSIQ